MSSLDDRGALQAAAAFWLRGLNRRRGLAMHTPIEPPWAPRRPVLPLLAQRFSSYGHAVSGVTDDQAAIDNTTQRLF
jgi:hypothetical protein